jgi:hypothetical protein
VNDPGPEVLVEWSRPDLPEEVGDAREVPQPLTNDTLQPRMSHFLTESHFVGSQQLFPFPHQEQKLTLAGHSLRHIPVEWLNCLLVHLLVADRPDPLS